MTQHWSAMVVMLMVVGVAPHAAAQGPGGSALRVGAAKVDVTPAAGELPKNSQGILDRLYARAIVLESGNATAALITVDSGAVPDAVWQAVTGQLQKELAIPAVNVLL